MTERKRHAEIAGAGIGGLAAACVLARRGWSVRIHERTGELREMGAGIYLKLNSLLVLKEVGALDAVRRAGMRLRMGEIRDERNEIVMRRELPEEEEALTILRGELHRILAETAIGLGVAVATSSVARAADPSGELAFESGERVRADLVIGADGYRSAVRESLGLTDRIIPLGEGAIRVLSPRVGNEREGYTTEFWSGDCRLGVVPCSKDLMYLYLMGPVDHPRARKLPVDREFWAGRFPQVADIVRRIPEDAGRHDELHLGKVKGWVSGRAAILGDAAHAQPPNLGQGAGMAIGNASALGAILDQEADVPAALRRWEAERRPLSEAVQTWSHRYGMACRGPMATLGWPRRMVFRGLSRVGFAARHWGYLWRGGYYPGDASTFTS